MAENISFELHDDANPESRKNKMKRFQQNPERNWGPKMRSKTSLLKDKEDEMYITERLRLAVSITVGLRK